MREPSLRPERSASANSATSASAQYFIPNTGAVNLDGLKKAAPAAPSRRGGTFCLGLRYIFQMMQLLEAPPMTTILAVAGLMLLLTLAGADLLVSGISLDELRRMGLRE